MIQVENLTHVYKSGKGVFDIDFSVKEGSITGYLGPNGAGKTTTIRALMGFIKAQKGKAFINNLDCFKDSEKIMKDLGYIAGEVSFIQKISCTDYLKYVENLRGIKGNSRKEELIERFNLDTKGQIKTFSKGMKQKLSIVTAFMHDPKVLILDEPTSGLDPLVQNEFVSLLIEEKKRGKTILMSSHIFEEVEKCCDQVLIIKEGRLAASSEISTLKDSMKKSYTVKTSEITKLKDLPYEVKVLSQDECQVFVKDSDIDAFIKNLAKIQVLDIRTTDTNLEDIFLNFYKEDK